MNIIKSLKTNIIWIILILAAILRLWNLSSVPPHLTPDEASLGYNAYSILKTGKDEYGKVLPLVFKSFGDYKPGLYIYLTVPSIAVLGLNEFSVRLPSALAGILAVYLIYLISLKLFDKKIALYAALVASITPWLIYFSRGAWEANVSLTLALAGIYFFLRSFEENKFLFLSMLSFSLTLIAYQGAKLSTGIIILILLVFYWKEVTKINKKYLFGSLFLGIIVSLPIIFSLFSGQAGRLEIFSIFSYPRPKEYTQAMLDEGAEKFGDVNYLSYHSEPYNYVRGILGRWFNHFSGRFLFFEGDTANPRHSAPYQGMLLVSDVFLVLFGLYAIFKEKLTKEKSLIILWLVLSPLPAVLSRDQVHAIRSLNMAIPLIMICSFGLSEIISLISKTKYKIIFYLMGVGIYFIGFIYFLDAYFIHVSAHDSRLWEYGYKQVVETISPIQSNYKTVKVQQSFAQPYIYFLFYQKYDPAKYQKESKFTESEFKGDVGYVIKLDNIEFTAIDWSVNRGDHGSLIVGDSIRIPLQDSNSEREFKLIKEIKYLNDRDIAFRIIEVK